MTTDDKEAKYIMKQHLCCVSMLRRLKGLPLYIGFQDQDHICMEKTQNILIAIFTFISLLKSVAQYVNTFYKTKL